MPPPRHFCAGLLVLLAPLALISPAAAAQRAVTLNASERSLLSAVNGVRTNHGLRSLTVDPALQRAARAHSATMLRSGRFTHGAMGARLAAHGVVGPRYGENLAWATTRLAAARRIVHSWLVSPGHRTNLLHPGWNRIGIGALRGTFLGHRHATVVTADFAGS
jgi:uncharacterized protein YkwD